MNKKKLKNMVLKYNRFLSFIYRGIHHNRISLNGAKLCLSGVFMKNSMINVRGYNNVIEIASGLTRINHCSFIISGSNCHIKIAAECNLNNATFYIEDNGGSIILDKHVTISGKTDFAVIEGCLIHVGEDCLFSKNISFRVGDSHSILDGVSGKRINPSKDINIGNHVWIGYGVTILKGSEVGCNSIIGTGAILTGKKYHDNCVVGGIPAKVLKENVDWCAERIFIE